jgi:anthranilate synthase/aminodeoxychorismate synthase-like glutamine amidotransferase
MIFVLDNYDSFTYNLVQYLGELGAEPYVRRNDELSLAEIEALNPEGIVISPGPGTPADAGVSVPLIRHFVDRLPVLGVCLGHQALGEAFGATIIRADRLMHGKTSPVEHTGEGIFAGISSPLIAMRYHSLVVDPKTVPDILGVTAWSGDRPRGSEIMGLQHRSRPTFGVQFHPESVGTAVGKQIIQNFLSIVASGVASGMMAGVRS